MKAFLKYACILILGMGSVLPVSAMNKEDAIISAFHNSCGFDYLTKEESDSMNVEELLLQLDESHQYKSYFELERILIKSYLFRGEVRLATAHSDRMYSKAHALSNTFGMALALNAMGEVYTYTGRIDDAQDAYNEALSHFDKLDGEDLNIRILLIELVEYNMRIRDKRQVAHFITRLNRYPAEQLNTSEKAVCYIYNAYYQLFKGHVDDARRYLDKIELLDLKGYPGITQYLQFVHARYWKAVGENEKALETYNSFLETNYSKANARLCRETLQEKADLLLKMNRKEEAYAQYGQLFSHIKTTFEQNYPQEITQLIARFQADQLAYQNEKDRIASMRFYLAGFVACSALLILFLLLGWKKIFRLKRSTQRQEVMKQKAEKAIQRKNMFLSNMSHEVRTPLNAIVGFSAVLTTDNESYDDESRKEFCEIIKVNSFQLLNLINDILDISDFENDNITFNIRTYDAVKLCRESVETVIASRNLQVEMRFDTSLTRLMIDTDDSRLRQVLINILVNAAKFTEQGSIVLELKLIDEHMAFFSVTDTGCGIPLEKQQVIFERFEKLNDSAQGTGLGLSICHLIVNHLNGEIWVDSQYTEGTRFCFTHPLKYGSKSIVNPAS